MSGMSPTPKMGTRVGRVAGAALGGAVTGVLVALIWRAGGTASAAATSACETANQDGFCVSVGPAAAAIAVVLLGALVVPRTVARHQATDARAATLTRLGFPLELPSVPGYYPIDAYATPGGSLEVSMGSDGAAPDDALAFTVDITRSGSSDGVFDLKVCHENDPQLTPQYACQADGPHRWLITESGSPGNGALAENGGMIAIVQQTQTPSGTPLPAHVVLTAVSSLRPASASAIAALG